MELETWIVVLSCYEVITPFLYCRILPPGKTRYPFFLLKMYQRKIHKNISKTTFTQPDLVTVFVEATKRVLYTWVRKVFIVNIKWFRLSCWLDGAGFESLKGLETSIFSKTSRPAVRSTQFPRVKRPEREPDHSPPH